MNDYIIILRVIVFILSVFLLLCAMCIIYVHFKETDQIGLGTFVINIRTTCCQLASFL